MSQYNAKIQTDCDNTAEEIGIVLWHYSGSWEGLKKTNLEQPHTAGNPTRSYYKS
jgi:hypothetical protein